MSETTPTYDSSLDENGKNKIKELYEDFKPTSLPNNVNGIFEQWYNEDDNKQGYYQKIEAGLPIEDWLNLNNNSNLQQFLRKDTEEVFGSIGDNYHGIFMIFEDNADIIENIRRYTQDRIRGKLTGPYPYEEDNVITNIYYYEDEVLGFESLKKWVKRFGESVVVLEPQEIGCEIYQEMLNPDEN